MKKVISMLLALTLVLGMGTAAFASVDGSNTKEVCPEGWSDLGNGVWISDEMSFDEMAEYHAEKTGMSIKEAKAELKVAETKKGKIETYEADTQSRRVVSVSLNVTSSYKPRLEFYVYTSNWNSYYLIESIYYITLHREYNGITKQFSGDITAWYRGNNKVEYDVNGDFYNNGTTTGGAGVNIGVGEKGSVSFSLTHASNHYKYFHVHPTVTFPGK